MTLSTRLGHPGEIGIDTLQPISTDEMVAGLVAARITFAVRTIETLTTGEIARLTAAGIGVAWYGEARVSGWSARAGAEDGARVARKALAMGLPPEVSAGCDMEAGVPDEATAVEYANAWYTSALATGVAPAAPLLYRGAGCGFQSPDTLFHSVSFRRYWHSMSVVPRVAIRGDCMIQLYPPNLHIGAVEVDYNVVQQDYLGGVPCFAVTG